MEDKVDKEVLDLLKACNTLGHLPLLFKITKKIAECDSIAEGYNYFAEEGRQYTEEDFRTELNLLWSGETIRDKPYIELGGLPVYKIIIESVFKQP